MNLLDYFDPYSLIATLFVIFLILPVHEFAHAWMAHKLGDDTAALQGRLTLNPIAHLDPMGCIVMFLTQGIGWAKPVPVDPRNFSRKVSMRGGMALTALAGPVSNLIMAFVLIVVMKIAPQLVHTYAQNTFIADVIFYILIRMVFINIQLALFNLIPVPPLDGSKILGFFIPAKLEAKWNAFYYKNPQVARAIPGILFLIVWLTPIITTPLAWLSGVIFSGLDWATSFVDILMKTLLG